MVSSAVTETPPGFVAVTVYFAVGSKDEVVVISQVDVLNDMEEGRGGVMVQDSTWVVVGWMVVCSGICSVELGYESVGSS